MAEQIRCDDAALDGEGVDEVVPVAVRAEQAVDERDRRALTRVDVVEVASVERRGHAGERV